MWEPEVWQAVWKSVVLFLPRLATGIIVFMAFWLLARGLRRVVVRLTGARQIDPILMGYLNQAVSLTLILFGAVTALGTVGVDVSALVAGLGLSGFALGFALKDIISNAVAGILVMLYKPFHHRDRIKVTDLEGTVVQIDLRYTVLEAEGKKILIPNASLFTNAVTVLEKGPEVPAPASPPGPDGTQPGEAAGSKT
jgi:small-conductance mechanosensitive channel